MPKGWTVPGRVKVTIAAQPPTNRKRDDDNLIASPSHSWTGSLSGSGLMIAISSWRRLFGNRPESLGRLLIEIEAIQ